MDNPFALSGGTPNMSTMFFETFVMVPMDLMSTNVSIAQDCLWNMNFLNSFRECSYFTLYP